MLTIHESSVKFTGFIGITVESTVYPVYQFTGRYWWQQFCQQIIVNLTVNILNTGIYCKISVNSVISCQRESCKIACYFLQCEEIIGDCTGLWRIGDSMTNPFDISKDLLSDDVNETSISRIEPFILYRNWFLIK